MDYLPKSDIYKKEAKHHPISAVAYVSENIPSLVMLGLTLQ